MFSHGLDHHTCHLCSLCSAHGASGSSGPDAESELRRLTLDMLHASGQDYEVVLTSGATAAIKLVCVSDEAGLGRVGAGSDRGGGSKGLSATSCLAMHVTWCLHVHNHTRA